MGKRAAIAIFAAISALALVIQIGGAGAATGFTTQVSPAGDDTATEPYIDIDRVDGTVWVAWQSSGGHVARSDDGGRHFVQTPQSGPFADDVGDVDIALGGPTPCSVAGSGCIPGTRRVYVSTLSLLPAPLQVKVAFSDDRGATWTINSPATVNPLFIDREWLAVYPSKVSANQDQVYLGYHDFGPSQIWVATSTNGGATFGPPIDVFAQDPDASTSTFCNSVPSGLEVDPQTGDVYAQWITAGLFENTSGGCNITQTENFHQVWISHSPPGGLLWDAHRVFDGGPGTNTDKIFATLAVDNSGTAGVPGTVYSVFPDNLRGPEIFDIWFARSLNKGVNWSQPVRVNSDKGSHYFPWIVAGSTGRVDFIWYNSPDYTPTDAEQSPWWVTFAQTVNGTSATPKFNQTSASSSVAHVGGICTNGLFCDLVSGGNRDLADSISIAIDRGGSAGLVWTDQGRVLHGPTHIKFGCVTSQQVAYAGAKSGLSCKGPAGPPG